MAILKITGCSGEIPRITPRLLPEAAAQFASNVRLEDGSLMPVRQAALRHTFTDTFTGPIKTIYLHGEDWLAWETVVNAAPGPVAQDRLYYTGDGYPKMRVGSIIYPLEIIAPILPITAGISGTATSEDITTRLYAYTWVTGFGEESEPSALTDPIDWKPGQTVTLSGFQSTPPGRNITKQRIYRSQSTASSGTSLFFIAERDSSSSPFTDNIAPEDFGEVLPSLDWNRPPETLAGLVPFINGMMIAFDGKDLYISEPYRPHAWPEKYRLTMDFNIVALGTYGTTIVVMTDGLPYIVQGTAPENLQQEKVEKNYPCINARGVVDLGYGIAYPTQDGLVIASSGGFSIATGALMTRNDWRRLSPETFVAGQYNGRYFASYAYVEDGIDTVYGTIILDLTGSTPFLIRASRYATAMYFDVKQSALFMVNDMAVYEWDAVGMQPEVMRYMTKPYVLPKPETYGAMLIEAHAPTLEEQAEYAVTQQAIAEHNAAIYAIGDLLGSMDSVENDLWPVNGDALGNYVPPKVATIHVYASNDAGDMGLVFTTEAINQVVRMPSIPRARKWQVEVIGTLQIDQIQAATTPRELNTV